MQALKDNLTKIENPFLEFPNYNCFACSPLNKSGLKLEFYKDSEYVYTFYTPDANTSGLPGVMHGGIAGVLADEIMFWAIFIFCEKIAFTTKIEVSYKKYIPIDKTIGVKGRVLADKKRIFKTSAEIFDNENIILASSDATYFASKLSTMQEAFNSGAFPNSFKKYFSD
jgi:acyl-coenzyme A thioesterase PaaI-like protein